MRALIEAWRMEESSVSMRAERSRAISRPPAPGVAEKVLGLVGESDKRKLREAGAIVVGSNAAAARLAGMIAS